MTGTQYRRQTLNVLIAGHRPNRLPKDEGAREKVCKGLAQVLTQLLCATQKQQRTLRLLSGGADGSDQWVWD